MWDLEENIGISCTDIPVLPCTAKGCRGTPVRLFFPIAMRLARALSSAFRTMSTLPATQRAIQIAEHGGPDVLRLNEIAVPKPSAGQIIVKVIRTSPYLRARAEHLHRWSGRA